MVSDQVYNSFITTPRQLAQALDLSLEPLEAVHAVYPLRISRYYLELIKQHGLPLFRQAVPDLLELSDAIGLDDPLDEENLSPVPNLVHKYPDRALFLVCNECATYCRFCTRKRKVGTKNMVINEATIHAGLEYLARTPTISDVLISGGDPLMLSDQRLDRLLRAIRAIPSIATIRIGTRVPCTLPARITPRLAAILKRYHPLYINTHFNHPTEVTADAARACTLLADAGIPLGCQTVLLRGVNDCPQTLQLLFYRLIRIRVKPYYLFQADLTKGSSHFRTTVNTGLAIMHYLIGNLTGMALPTYALDAPGGGGKIPLTPQYVQSLDKTLDFITCCGSPCSYPNQTHPDSFQSSVGVNEKKNYT
ncbi:KamA family radical SAM protein [Desulfobulbus alkaliphilus]|uniref:KamA family radical SAM protein n=1 Tax=Desulfobulbus alkaliphilus TaxID=869814 RepID=UPI0019665194|nr:KamA family radical SAM protein [Desulfobulbus alkaliphilus]MBM9536442.1 KamA family radical SAM protein [Desulfobulbus alkaliphilus]